MKVEMSFKEYKAMAEAINNRTYTDQEIMKKLEDAGSKSRSNIKVISSKDMISVNFSENLISEMMSLPDFDKFFEELADLEKEYLNNLPYGKVKRFMDMMEA